MVDEHPPHTGIMSNCDSGHTIRRLARRGVQTTPCRLVHLPLLEKACTRNIYFVIAKHHYAAWRLTASDMPMEGAVPVAADWESKTVDECSRSTSYPVSSNNPRCQPAIVAAWSGWDAASHPCPIRPPFTRRHLHLPFRSPDGRPGGRPSGGADGRRDGAREREYP